MTHCFRVLNPGMLRGSMAMVGAMGCGTACLWFLPSPPFCALFAVCAFLSGATHFAAWLAFPRFKHTPLFFISLTWLNIALLSLVAMDTGGMSSPFVFLFFWIIISEAIYGIEDRWVPLFAAACYLFSVCGSIHGFLGHSPTLRALPYPNLVIVWVVAGLNCAYIVLAGMSSRLIISAVLAKLAVENEQKEGLFKKLSELEATAQIGALAHRIAHDLRGPLAAISGCLQIEMSKDHTKESMDAFKDLDETVNGMAASLSAITSFGKTSPVPAERLDLAEFFRQLLAVASFSPNARGVKFVKRFNEKQEFCVIASRPDLQQAYFNLLKNAVEAVADNSNGKVIEISLGREGSGVVVTISDNGPGMPLDLLKTVFRRSITTKKDGTGVGLMITRELLSRNGGDIQFFNKPDGGLNAISRLPLAV